VTGILRRSCLFLGAWLASVASMAEPLRLDDFPASGEEASPPWKLVRFDDRIPPTRYRLGTMEGRRAVIATADSSMALLGRSIDEGRYAPSVLCWQWRVEAPLRTADLRTREGDDFAARVYVGLKLPRRALGIATRLALSLARARHGDYVPDAALNYVWDNRYPVGTEQANAYTDRAHMIVVESGAERARQWVPARRNVMEDAERAFGTQPEAITLVAIGVDTDNTGETASAAFAGLALVDAESACPTPPP
jgi:hypothetical protein